MFGGKRTQQQQQTAQLRASGISLSRASHYANGRRQRSKWLFGLILALPLGYVGSATAIYFLNGSEQQTQAQAPEIVQPVAPAQPPQPSREDIAALVAEETARQVALITAAAEAARNAAPQPVEQPVQQTVEQPAAQPVIADAPVAAPAPDPDALAMACINNLTKIARSLRVDFASGSSEPLPDDLNAVAALAARAMDCPNARIIVEGHSDATGEEFSNVQISWLRAENTIAYLVGLGFEPDLFEPIGYGSRVPAAEGDGSEDDAYNRRVEFNIAVKPDA